MSQDHLDAQSAEACPQCGATLAPGETCRERFDAAQLIEVSDSAYYAVHHLSVPCYMLQHNIYSRRGWLAVRSLLHEFLYQGLTPQAARKRDAAEMDSGRRTWSITKGAKLPGVENVRWTFTIADVRVDTAEHYCADVRRWAEAVLADTQHLANEPGDAG